MATFTWLYFVLGLLWPLTYGLVGWQTGEEFSRQEDHMCLSEYIFFLSQEANKTSKVMLWCMKTTILSTCKIILKKNTTSVQQGTSWKSRQRFWEHLQQLPVVPSRPPCFVLAGLHGVTFGCWLHVNWYSLFSSGVTVARLKIVGQIRHQANQRSDGCRKREASVKKKESQ